MFLRNARYQAGLYAATTASLSAPTGDVCIIPTTPVGPRPALCQRRSANPWGLAAAARPPIGEAASHLPDVVSPAKELLANLVYCLLGKRTL